ncbi:hypothetical protein WICPIJ_000899 [Wickerhamomyces pijperi]|uniref:Uncharacterized protein n=1 Tax=Wickerhamomyces pijperi TaxID=599730 RepID=A0A9P8TQF7_WICPI|nr:hypothetical protein WICPIJ_000899 [Wickerhamomyces pijperi]
MSITEPFHSVTEQFLPSQSSTDIHHDFEEEIAGDSDVCRRCILPISEGHAYELGGDRWHTYCFSCSKCSKLLGTSSNFLVLGNGDLICSECSYNCNACGKKIDDLAILTGDQAYCSSCFCCRNCKNRIQDLRYARTTKGLFCMTCHEKLLERKKRAEEIKKLQRLSKHAADHKSLPSIPDKGIEKPPSPDIDSDAAAYTPGVLEETDTMSVKSLNAPPKISQSKKDQYRIPARSPKRQSASLVAPKTLEPAASLTPQQPTGPEFQNNQLRSPLNMKSPLRTPRSVANQHRSEIVVESLSQSSTTNNLFQEYLSADPMHDKDLLADLTQRSPPPSIPLPKIEHVSIGQLDVPDDDFIDMNDSDEFSEDFSRMNFKDVNFGGEQKENIPGDKYSAKPKGLSDTRSNNGSFPTGLNIKGLANFNDQLDNGSRFEYSNPGFIPENSPSPSPHKYNRQQTLQPQANIYPPAVSPQLQQSQNDSTGAGLSRSKSIRSPKNFLSFRKHRKNSSQSSIEKNLISSPITEPSKAVVLDHLSTPKSQEMMANTRSPLSGASLFRTQPIYENQRYGSLSQPSSSGVTIDHIAPGKRRISSHSRSRSEANPTIDSSTFEVNNLELEARAMRLEIVELSQTKSGLVKDINELSNVKDNITREVAALMRQIESLKSNLGQSISAASAGSQSLSGSPIYQNRETPSSAEDEKKPSSKRFWKRGNIFNRGETNLSAPGSTGNSNIAHSQSSYSISGIMGYNNSNSSHEDKQSFQISAPILKSDDADELGGNDNRKLTSSQKFLDLQQSMNLNSSVASSASSTGFMTKQSNGSSGAVSSSSLIMSDLFNSTLEMRAQYEKRDIPIIITRLVQEIEANGLKSEGLYRKNGSTLQMNILLKAFNSLYQSETSTELDQLCDNSDINTLTSSLKRYLYFHLPEGIITQNLYQQFIETSILQSDDLKVKALANVISQLPVTNQKVLRYILDHLSHVESYKSFNKMTFHNLSVVFASSLIRITDHERELADMEKKNQTTEHLLMNYKKVWGLL